MLSEAHLEGFDESPQQSPDSLTPAQQFDQSHHSEQAEEGDWDTSTVFCVLGGNMWRVVRGRKQWTLHPFMWSVIT